MVYKNCVCIYIYVLDGRGANGAPPSSWGSVGRPPPRPYSLPRQALGSLVFDEPQWDRVINAHLTRLPSRVEEEETRLVERLHYIDALALATPVNPGQLFSSSPMAASRPRSLPPRILLPSTSRPLATHAGLQVRVVPSVHVHCCKLDHRHVGLATPARVHRDI